MALMSLRLWELALLALPMFILLSAQAMLMAAWAIFITNMVAVTERLGHSPLAFLVVPMVGAFFIDIANAIIIKLFLAVIT